MRIKWYTVWKGPGPQWFAEQGLKKISASPLCFSVLSQSLFWTDHLCFTLCTEYANALLLVYMLFPWLCGSFFGSPEILHGVERTPQIIWKPSTLTPWLNFIGLFHSWVLCAGPLYPLGAVGRMPSIYENLGALNKKLWLQNTKTAK